MSKLTKEELERYKLVPVSWQKIHDWKIETVYIQAKPDAPVYGPYVVKDALTFAIANLDGSKPRMYPRDEGLLVTTQIIQARIDVTKLGPHTKKVDPFQIITEKTPESSTDFAPSIGKPVKLTEEWAEKLNQRVLNLEAELKRVKAIQTKFWDLVAEIDNYERSL